MRVIKKERENKKAVYIIGSVIFVVIFFIWMMVPAMNKSLWDASTSNTLSSKKSQDLALLDSAGIDAPGSPLTGALIDNPATRLDLEASSLFKMPESEISYEDSVSSGSLSDVSSDYHSLPSASVGGGSEYVPKGKLSKLPSLSGSNPGTMTAGGVSNKFFGSEVASAKLIPPLEKSEVLLDSKKKVSFESGKNAFKALQIAKNNSVAAQNAKSAEQAKANAISAFEKTNKPDNSLLTTGVEAAKFEGESGFGDAVDNLKRNNPELNKKKITPPQPKKDEEESKKLEDELKMMILQIILQATLGQMFGAIGMMMARSICPECYGTGQFPTITGSGTASSNQSQSSVASELKK